nr:uncharacterized protein LOC125424291 isoform X2 [Ziziphus jujuba var. spinosa]
MGLRKGNSSIDEFIKRFNTLCDNLAAIGKPVEDLDKCFHLSRGLGQKYQDFRLAMLSKQPYPTFTQFVLALRSHEQMLLDQEEVKQIDLNQAFIGHRSRGRGNRGGGRFSSRGRGFAPANRFAPHRNYDDSRWNRQTQQEENRWIWGPSRIQNQQIQRSDKNGNHSSANSPIICQICEMPYHTASKCWYRYDYLDKDEPRVEAHTSFKDAGSSQFYADSGANAHMINSPGQKSEDNSEGA